MPMEDITKITEWLGAGAINIFGLPFSGKDTQATVLADVCNASVIGGGDVLRNSSNQRVKKIIGGGNLAPTKEYLEMILPLLASPSYAHKPLVLSSVGRWDGEQQHVMRAAIQSKHPIRAVIYIKISDSLVHTRWAEASRQQTRGKREDDEEHKLETRIKEFYTKTEPVIRWYEKKNLLVTVDGSEEPQQVSKAILRALTKRARSNDT